MRKTQRQTMIEEIERSKEELFELDFYCEPGVLEYHKDFPWDERKNYIAHSALKVMVGQIRKDLKDAKAARYDQIAPHYEQLLLDLDR